VVTTLREELLPLDLINGKEIIRKSQTKGQLVPDFVFEMPNQKHKIAIELEMTMKSEQRYRDILTDYRCSKEFEKVIYVTPNVGIRDKCLKVLGQDQPPKNLRVLSSGKFEFRLLDDLLNDDEAVASIPIITNNLNPSEKGSAA
jgi:hypothetical protein